MLPGAPTPHEEELRALAAELGIAERVRFLDWVSSEDLEGLFAAAEAFVLPSLIEGFGLPIVEAMQRGVPVACSDAPPPEVAAGGALSTRDESHRRRSGTCWRPGARSGRPRPARAQLTWRTRRATPWRHPPGQAAADLPRPWVFVA